jgi:hypothetical protein
MHFASNKKLFWLMLPVGPGSNTTAVKVLFKKNKSAVELNDLICNVRETDD